MRSCRRPGRSRHPSLLAEVRAGRTSVHAACVAAGIAKPTMTVPLDPVAMARAIRAQSTRRNLEPGELLRCIARLDVIKQRGERTDLAPRGAKSGKSAVETATLVGVGGRTVERARKVLADDDARAAVESGEKSINAASKDVRPGRRLYRYEGSV